jgi:hypothetical protein
VGAPLRDDDGAVAEHLAHLFEAPRAVIRCRIGGDVLPLELCEERLVVPGLYARVSRGHRSYLDP